MRSEVIARYVIVDGQLVDVQIRQESDAAPPAGVFWPRPRGVEKALLLLRRVLRMERTRTAEVHRV